MRLARVILLALCAAALVPAAAQASCIPMTDAERRASADVIFDGIALEGPTATGIQRFQVTRYRKGTGPRVVRVNTGYVRRADGTGTVTSISLEVRKGERWRIFAHGSARKVLRSSQCDGSRKL